MALCGLFNRLFFKAPQSGVSTRSPKKNSRAKPESPPTIRQRARKRLAARRRRLALSWAGMILLIALAGWGVYGGRIIQDINPMLRAELALPRIDLNAWVTPPQGTGEPPQMVATPAVWHLTKHLTVMAGSTLNVRIDDHDKLPLELVVGDKTLPFIADTHGAYAASVTLTEPVEIGLRRDGVVIANWSVHVRQTPPPRISFDEMPIVTPHGLLNLSYTAHDHFSLSEVTATITPDIQNMGHMNAGDTFPVTTTLSTAHLRGLQHVDLVTLSDPALAGHMVSVQLHVVDTAGRHADSDIRHVLVPPMTMTNPLATALMEFRRMLISRPDDPFLRNEIANALAGLAHQPDLYGGDMTMTLALRSSAVRMLLDSSKDAARVAGQVLALAAVRAQNGGQVDISTDLREAIHDLSAVLDDAESTTISDSSVGDMTALLARTEQAFRLLAHAMRLDDADTLALWSAIQILRDKVTHNDFAAARSQLNHFNQLWVQLDTGVFSAKPIAMIHKTSNARDFLNESADQGHDEAPMPPRAVNLRNH